MGNRVPKADLQNCQNEFAAAETALAETNSQLTAAQTELSGVKSQLDTANASLTTCTNNFDQCQTNLGQTQNNLIQCEANLDTVDLALSQAQNELALCTNDLNVVTANLAEKNLIVPGKTVGLCNNDGQWVVYFTDINIQNVSEIDTAYVTLIDDTTNQVVERFEAVTVEASTTPGIYGVEVRPQDQGANLKMALSTLR